LFKIAKAICPGIIQQPVKAGSRRIGVKTERAGVDQCWTWSGFRITIQPDSAI